MTLVDVSSTGTLNGVELTVVKEWSRHPRVLHNGQELPRDRWGNYQFHDDQGRPCQLEVSYNLWELRPRVRTAGHSVLLGRALPVWVRVIFLVFFGLGFFGGALGAALAFASGWGSLALLRRTDRRTVHVVTAILLPLLAVLVYGLLAAPDWQCQLTFRL